MSRRAPVVKARPIASGRVFRVADLRCTSYPHQREKHADQHAAPSIRTQPPADESKRTIYLWRRSAQVKLKTSAGIFAEKRTLLGAPIMSWGTQPRCLVPVYDGSTPVSYL
jgi:hypothetical protein